MLKRGVMVKPKRPTKPVSATLPTKSNIFFSLSFFLSILLFGMGQVIFFYLKSVTGIILSVIGAVLSIVIYFKGRNFSLTNLTIGHVSPKLDRNLLKNKKMNKLIALGGFPNSDVFKPVFLISVICIILSFILAGIGQSLLRQDWEGSTLVPGCLYFLIASILFVAGLWPWFRERLKAVPISFKTEMIIFSSILILGLFLRVYHITSMPQGLFTDQGFVGYSALRIIHEGWRPFYIPEIYLMAYSFTIYQLAFWFKVFGESETSLKIFYVFLSMAGLPLIYWTFRQLAGVRVALLTLFILAIMRWHIIFSRNAFPTIQVPLYLFGTLAFLIYGINSSKKWAFFTAGLFFSLGFYTYQGFKIAPLLLLVYAIYEACTNWEKVKKNWRNIVGFLILSFLITSPVLRDMISMKSFGDRESQLSIISKIQEEHSIKPFLDVLFKTSLMFNRRGDRMPRHNLQDYQMLDNVSAVLFILGLAYGIIRIKRRKYFYAVIGFFVTSLLCILTTDPAHANRLLALTPFLAFLIATPIVAVWGWILRFWGSKVEWIFILFLTPFLWVMASQNFDVYFNKQANSNSGWWEYDTRETNVGRRINQYGDAYEYYLSPDLTSEQTISFLGYNQLNHIHNMVFPEALISHSSNSSRGTYFAVDGDRPEIVELLKSLYPEAVDEPLLDLKENKALFFLEISRDQLKKVLGLKAVFDRPVNGVQTMQITNFPDGLPEGPYRVTLTGNLFVDQTDDYRWSFGGTDLPKLWIGHRLASSAIYQHLDKGYHPIQIQLTAKTSEIPILTIKEQTHSYLPIVLKAGSFNNLPAPRGLKGSYYGNSLWDKGKPSEVQWDPLIDFGDGKEMPITPVYSIHWNGKFFTDQTGKYQIFIQTGSIAGLKIDGRSWFELGKSLQGNGYLKAGVHAIDVYCVNTNRQFLPLTLSWVKPDGYTEVIPNSVFGEIP